MVGGVVTLLFGICQHAVPKQIIDIIRVVTNVNYEPIINKKIMITFVRHAEIQLFSNFIDRYADAELLRNRTEHITVVVPGDIFAGAFWDSDPFAFNRVINNGCIWYNEYKVNEIGLDQEECYACIAHELGHMMDPNQRNPEHQQDREIYADRIACELGLRDSMISALHKMIDYYQQPNGAADDNVRIENLQERINVLA